MNPVGRASGHVEADAEERPSRPAEDHGRGDEPEQCEAGAECEKTRAHERW